MSVSRRSFLALAAGAIAARAAGENRPMIIDAHCHAGLGQEMSAPWTTRADPEVTLARMAEAGIDRTIIFPINNTDFERPNHEIAEICARYPGKFIGFAKHDPESESGRIRALLKREVESLGLKGLKLHRLPTREVLDTVTELRIPVLYHPEKVSNFHLIASEYPQVPFIMAHLVARRYSNVYLETSSVVFLKFLERAVKELGAEKLIFGSDGPEVDSRVELYKVRLLRLPPADEAKVLGGNILRLLPPGSV